MTIDSELTQHIYKGRMNLLQNINNLGYNTFSYENPSINEISIMDKNNQLDMIFNHQGKTIYCKYLLHKSVRAPYLEEIIEELYSIKSILKEDDIIVLISQNNENDTIKLYLRKLFTDRKIFIVHMMLEQLQFNILEHNLVPKHTILTGPQVKNMQLQYNIISNNTLPEISRFDPVAKAILLKPGDIVHIERPSKTAITSDYYRVCINK